VAIVPFSTIGTTPDGEYLTAGIAQDVGAHLASLRGLRIIAGTSTLRYKDRAQSPVEIATALGVATVVDGSVQRIGDQLHVVVRLVDALSGEQLWSDVFDRDVRRAPDCQPSDAFGRLLRTIQHRRRSEDSMPWRRASRHRCATPYPCGDTVFHRPAGPRRATGECAAVTTAPATMQSEAMRRSGAK